jgi:hypothetical protein
MNTSEMKTGTIAMVKVGRNEVKVEVLEALKDAFKVKSLSTDREFTVKSLVSIVSKPKESGTLKPKKLSLIDAAFAVLSNAGEPLNTREMVKRAIEAGLWTPTSCKTPEQTLYGSIFREIKVKEFPRFSKSATRKGAFVAMP